MDKDKQEELIKEWKEIRANFFNLLDEDMLKFKKHYSSHPLYDSVVKHFDKSFRDINQIAINEIKEFLNNKSS